MAKQSKKQFREHKVLMGLIELYLQTGKHIGSNTLRENGFEDLSSATIRNYFVTLENQGYLKQPHASGGRIPTNAALKLFAEEMLAHPQPTVEAETALQRLKQKERRDIALYLQEAAELLSETTGYAVFLSSVRFDHDLIQKVKLLELDENRVLAVIITDFGQILTEILPVEQKLSSFSMKRIEGYFQWRIHGGMKPVELTPQELELSQKFYHEIMVRYLVRYSNFSDEDIYRTGFSRLLHYPEFNDPVTLTAGLSLFENNSQMRLILNDCTKTGDLRFWVGEDLIPYAASSNCSVVAIPFRIGHSLAGAVGILGPTRMPYKAIFGAMQLFSNFVSETLTHNLKVFNLTFRQPRSGKIFLEGEERSILLLERKESQ